MDAHAPRHLAARAAHVDHVADRFLVAELVGLDLRVVARDRQVGAVAGALEDVVRDTDLGRARLDLRGAGRVREHEALDRDVRSGRCHVEAVRARDLDSADGLRA
jgi:hypothetical protein